MATDVALHCVHATLRMLSGHGQALSVDQKDLQLRLFEVTPTPTTAATLTPTLAPTLPPTSTLTAQHSPFTPTPTPTPPLTPHQALHEPEAVFDAALLATALDCLEHLCKHRTSLLAARTASFVRRMLQMALVAPHGHAVALLCAISR